MSDPQKPEAAGPPGAPASSTPTSRSRSPAPSRPRADRRRRPAAGARRRRERPTCRRRRAGTTMLHQIATGNAIISVLAVLLALLVGAIMIAFTDERVQETSGYFFASARPTRFGAIWDSVAGAYSALFQGSIYNFRRDDFVAGIRPLTETLTFATPLIAAASAWRSRSASACSTSVVAARC